MEYTVKNPESKFEELMRVAKDLVDISEQPDSNFRFVQQEDRPNQMTFHVVERTEANEWGDETRVLTWTRELVEILNPESLTNEQMALGWCVCSELVERRVLV